MAKQRSPNCPQITFLEAAEKARLIYSKEHTYPADKQAIAEDLGYTSLSGASLSALGALRQYGLLEPSGDGLRISGDAVDYFEGEGSSKGYTTMKLAFRPTLFGQLWTEYAEKLPSDSSLRHSLIKKGFLPKAADEVIRVYKENFKLAENADSEYTTDEERDMTSAETPGSKTASAAATTATIPAGAASISTPVGKDEDGKAVFAHVRFDSALRKEFVTGLKKYLDYLETTLN